LLVREWNQLTLQRREQVQEEVHGVASNIQEEDEFVNKCLSELDEELRIIRKRSAYDKAVFLNPSYVKNRDFGLMFLRSEYFDARKAANRLVDHFEMKLELFGVEKLAKDITLEDLREDALDCLNCGTIQVLPNKDRSGRTVICALQAYQKYDTCSIPDVSKNDVVFHWRRLSLVSYSLEFLMTLHISLLFMTGANGLVSVYGSLGRFRISTDGSSNLGL
jgi:hypothetical protein